jgi:hypothetical protein
MDCATNQTISSNNVCVQCNSCSCHPGIALPLTPLPSGSPWYCETCTASIFPFSHFGDEQEFSAEISQDATETLSPDCLRDLLLQPIDEYVDGRSLLADSDVDPDKNLFNYTNSCSSNYIGAGEVISKLVRPCYNEVFSLLHLNCRSMTSKLSDIQLLLAQTDATVLIVTET